MIWCCLLIICQPIQTTFELQKEQGVLEKKIPLEINRRNRGSFFEIFISKRYNKTLFHIYGMVGSSPFATASESDRSKYVEQFCSSTGDDLEILISKGYLFLEHYVWKTVLQNLKRNRLFCYAHPIFLHCLSFTGQSGPSFALPRVDFEPLRWSAMVRKYWGTAPITPFILASVVFLLRPPAVLCAEPINLFICGKVFCTVVLGIYMYIYTT